MREGVGAEGGSRGGSRGGEDRIAFLPLSESERTTQREPLLTYPGWVEDFAVHLRCEIQTFASVNLAIWIQHKHTFDKRMWRACVRAVRACVRACGVLRVITCMRSTPGLEQALPVSFVTRRGLKLNDYGVGGHGLTSSLYRLSSETTWCLEFVSFLCLKTYRCLQCLRPSALACSFERPHN